MVGHDRGITIHVTPMAGILWATPYGPFNLANEGWNELKAKAGAEVDQPTYMQQFACHAIYAPSANGIFGGNTTWDLEGFRGTNSDPVSIGGVANHQCNWRPGT